MYTDVTIEHFRSVAHLRVGPLRRINVVVGTNNSGKTTLLEALFLLGGGPDARNLSTLAQLRGQAVDAGSMDAVWRPIFHEMRTDREVILHGSWQGEPSPRSLRIRVLQPGQGPVTATTTAAPVGNGIGVALPANLIPGVEMVFRSGRSGQAVHTETIVDSHSGQLQATSRSGMDGIPTTLLSARAFSTLARNAQQLSLLLRMKLEREVLEAVRIIDPRIQRVEVLVESSGPTVYVDVGLDSLVPLAVSGEGIVRLFSIAVELLGVRGGALLIDEIDNGLHHSVMGSLWRILGLLAEKHDVQVVATTHNEEMLFAALEVFKDHPDTLGLFRIDRRDGGQHTVASYDAEAQEAVRDLYFEVRG